MQLHIFELSLAIMCMHLKKPKFIGAEQQIIKVIPGSRTNKIAHRIKSEALLYSLNKSK